ncbi:hypothetical protein [Bacillus thuringiensis]|uniref:Uncharacterized protein n=1 Tax=Bacillus thuringiensis serovar andalousiensis TaxID=257985 RepID=A0A6H0TR96_BACTU|nr:hypothetical protein [Bacillus thuringiensis]QIW22490.1 hypothetical protein EVG22_31560 [Bacillus thuringiensis serovar andalousiensis]
MQQKILVITSNLLGTATISEFDSKEAAKEQVKKLIKKGISLNAIRVTQEIPMNIDIQVDVEF